MLTHRSMIVAGWLAMASAFITLPLAYVSFLLEGKTDPTSSLMLSIMQVFGTLLFIAIILYLKRLLNSLFQFHDTNGLMALMIVANSVAGFFVVLSLTFPQLKETMGVVATVLVIFQGVIQVQFGYRLLRLEDNLGGLLKPFCYSNMATGICIASVVLIFFGVVVSAIADLMLGTIFFQIAKTRFPQEKNEMD